VSNQVFPALPGLAFSVTKAPQWATKKQRSTGGMEVTGSYYTLPIWKWTLTYEFLREFDALAEFQTLVGFFNARQGASDSFLYDDPTDDTATVAAPQPFGTGDGTTTTFQLARTYGGFSEPVYNLNGSATLYDNGSTISPAGYAIANGLVTFTTAPAAGHALTWSGAYYWRVRFSDDTYDFDYFAYQFWSAKKIVFESVKGS
jgi:uncharacterized protein (TIGR02217 family)